MTPCLKCLHLAIRPTEYGKFCSCELNAPGWMDGDCEEFVMKDSYGRLFRILNKEKEKYVS